MKKFYRSVITTIIFFLFVFFLDAQTVYQTTNAGTLATPLLLSQNSSWQGGSQPPNNCNDCKIIINSPSTIDDAVGKVVITGTLSEIDVFDVNGPTSLEIDQWIELHDTKVIVSNNATVYINDEVDMYGSTTVQLGNVNSIVNANNDNGHTVNGTGTPANDVGWGLFYITGTSAGVISTYDVTLSQIGMGNNTNTTMPFTTYTINCDAAYPPNTCGTGLVFGPALTQTGPPPIFPYTASLFEFIQSAVLPVELVQFTASRNADQTNNIAWTTSQETNASYYGVERSADGSTWQPLGTVKAKGFSSTTTNYQYKDANPLNGTN
ncbi:MAG TPA: hypothetical protein VMI12_11355, partial [Puia sp.]|nr:hypothetical protein [Puia sp.]